MEERKSNVSKHHISFIPIIIHHYGGQDLIFPFYFLRAGRTPRRLVLQGGRGRGGGGGRRARRKSVQVAQHARNTVNRAWE